MKNEEIAKQKFLFGKDALMQGIEFVIREHHRAYRLAAEITPQNYEEKCNEIMNIYADASKKINEMWIFQKNGNRS